MTTIFDHLLEGWAKTIDEIGLLPQYQQKVSVVKYSKEDCFKLEDFTPESFPSGNTLLDEVPGDAILSYEEYGLDANGLPCYCRTLDKQGQPTAAGFYRYTPEAVEFVQYNLSYSVPHVFKRMVLRHGQKIAFLHAVANGGGFGFSGMTPGQAIEAAKNDKYSVFLFVQEYEYEQGRIVRDVSNHRSPGVGDYSVKGYYSYDPAGKLIEIKDVSPEGWERLRYYYRDETEELQQLAHRLANEMAAAIVNALLEEEIETPLAILQLSYHYADVYLPILVPLSVKEKDRVVAKKNTAVWQGLFFGGDALFDTKLKGIERTFTQFMNQVDTGETHDLARAMLQKTSALLTASRLDGRIPVDPEFFAYAIDHSIEGHDAEDFKNILLNCGMSAEQYTLWESRGWIG